MLLSEQTKDILYFLRNVNVSFSVASIAPFLCVCTVEGDYHAALFLITDRNFNGSFLSIVKA